jgi:hypothetical protein
MSSRVVSAVLALAAVVAGLAPAAAVHPVHAASSTTTPVSISSFGRIVVDPASAQVFVSGPVDNEGGDPFAAGGAGPR